MQHFGVALSRQFDARCFRILLQLSVHSASVNSRKREIPRTNSSIRPGIRPAEEKSRDRAFASRGVFASDLSVRDARVLLQGSVPRVDLYRRSARLREKRSRKDYRSEYRVTREEGRKGSSRTSYLSGIVRSGTNPLRARSSEKSLVF